MADAGMQDVYRYCAHEIILNGTARFAPPELRALTDAQRAAFIETQAERFWPELQRWAVEWFAYNGMTVEEFLRASGVG